VLNWALRRLAWAFRWVGMERLRLQDKGRQVAERGMRSVGR
jgi:hypothetical protein